MQHTTQTNAMEHLKDVARRAVKVKGAMPFGGSFDDLAFGGDAYPESSVLELIDEADAVYWEVRPGIEYAPEMLIIERGEWRVRFDISLPKKNV